jgi:hypothetical protein
MPVLQLPPQGLAEAAHGELAGAIDAVAGKTDGPEAGADVHDDGGLAQPGQQGPGELDGRLDVEQQLACHLLAALIFQPGELVAARTVDEHVQPSSRAGCCSSCAAHGESQDRPSPSGGDPDEAAPGAGAQGAGPTTVQQQMGTLGRQFMGQGFTNAATGASQQYAFAFKLHWQDPVS